VGVVGLGLIALPYYFFRSRGARGGATALALALLCLVAMGLLTTAGEYATYYGWQGGLSADADADDAEDAQDSASLTSTVSADRA
jgi:hypothetical protein